MALTKPYSTLALSLATSRRDYPRTKNLFDSDYKSTNTRYKIHVYRTKSIVCLRKKI